MHERVWEELYIPKDLYQMAFPTGSSWICNPPVLNTDIDFAILSGDWDKLDLWCIDNGFKTNYEDYAMEAFRSYKRGPVNLIVTNDETFFRKFGAASLLAKKLNLLDKEQRIICFDFLMYEPAIL